MTGPGFHEFLIRSANDRLLTDRERLNVIGVAEVRFVDLTNKRWELAQEGIANGYADNPRRYPGFRFHERAVQYGAARAPLELIAHVVENDLPYTEILTADYIMANPMAAAAYGATTEFDNPEDVTEFKPSEIARYFRRDRSMIVEENPPNVWRVINPGNLSTDYPTPESLTRPLSCDAIPRRRRIATVPAPGGPTTTSWDSTSRSPRHARRTPMPSRIRTTPR